MLPYFLLVSLLFVSSLFSSPPVVHPIPQFKKVVLWGYKLHSHTHSYIHWGFFRAFKHLGYETYWLDDQDDVSKIDFSGALFITIEDASKKIPMRHDCYYVLHNCDYNRFRELYENNRCITLQVYTHDVLERGDEKIDDFIHCDRK